MLKRKDHHQIIYAIVVILFLLSQIVNTSKANSPKPEIKKTLEQQDRSVDEAALSIQSNAIETLKKHLQRPKNNEQEQRLLIKLSEYYIEKSSLEFRVSFGSIDEKRKKKYSHDYQNSLITATTHLSTLIKKYPHFEDIDQAYFMRAKSFQDLEQKNHARSDYEFIAKNFPNSAYLLPTLMSLGEYAVENNEHETALHHFKKVENSPESPYYPYALFKSAWSHYNLKNTELSLQYLEKHYNYYLEKEKNAKGLSSSDYAVKENTLLDMALFYFEGIESKIPQYSSEKAIQYFTKFDNGDTFGKMSIRFAKLLRSREYNNELIAFKNQFLTHYFKNTSSLPILITSFEHFIHRRNWENALQTSSDFVTLYQKNKELITQHENYGEAQELLLKTADDIRKTTIKNKTATKVNELTAVLAGLYENFTRFVPETDPRIPGAYYNLAETLFTIKDFDKAKEHYRWIVDHKTKINTKLIDPKDAELKSISSFYEVLKNSKTIALEVKASALNSEKPLDLTPDFERWISWLDQYDHNHKTKSKEFEAFLFEGIRSLYRMNHKDSSIKRLQTFIESYPQSEFSIAAATLILDTYTLSSDWKNAHNYANKLRKSLIFSKTDFDKKLYEIASTSYFKVAENFFIEKNYKIALETCQDHLKRYEKSTNAAECLFLSSQASLFLENETQSLAYLTELIHSHKTSRHVLTAIHNRAKISEAHYDFKKAAEDMHFYYQSKSKDKDFSNDKKIEIKNSIIENLAYAYDFEKLMTLSKNSEFCDSKLIEECKLKTAVTILESNTQNAPAMAFIHELQKEKAPELKSIHSIFLLKQNQKAMSSKQSSELLKTLALHYNKSNAFTQNILTPYFHGLVTDHFKNIRMEYTQKTTLKATERSIGQRIKNMEELEKLATLLVAIPWKKLQIDILSETAQIYFDFSTDLEKLTSTEEASSEPGLAESNGELKTLIAPFLNKGLALNKKAIEISQNVIIDKNIRAVLLDIQNRKTASMDPTLNKNQKNEIDLPFTLNAHIDFFNRLAPALNIKSTSQNEIKFDKTNEKEFLISNALRAISENKYFISHFYLQKLESKALLEKEESLILKSYHLAHTGATAESFFELSKNFEQLHGDAKSYMTLSLAAYYTYTQEEKNASEWLNKFITISHKEQKFYTRYTSNQNENFLIAYGIDLYKVKTNLNYYTDLLTSIKAYGSKEHSLWAQGKISALSPSKVISQNNK